MVGRESRPKQSPSISTIAVMVGAVGLSLAGSFPGGLNAQTGFFLAFAATFLIGCGALLFVRQSRFEGNADGSEPPAGSAEVPRGPSYPVGPGGDLGQDQPTRRRGSPARWRGSPAAPEEDPPRR